ncbi:hypothetical protein BDW67DRAFT_184106 [Aspergillus spinulosporus]
MRAQVETWQRHSGFKRLVEAIDSRMPGNDVSTYTHLPWHYSVTLAQDFIPPSSSSSFAHEFLSALIHFKVCFRYIVPDVRFAIVLEFLNQVMTDFTDPSYTYMGELPGDRSLRIFIIDTKELVYNKNYPSHPMPAGLYIDCSQGEYLHSEDLESFVRSADKCPLWALILRQLYTTVKHYVQKDTEITDAGTAAQLFAPFVAEYHLYMLDPAPVILMLDDSKRVVKARYISTGTTLLDMDEGVPNLGLGLFWDRLLHDNGDSLETLRSRGNDNEVLARLAAWLREREAGIPSWSSAGCDRRLPTRVLDLEYFVGDTQPGARDADIRLFEPAAGQCGRYVALSYCWGR